MTVIECFVIGRLPVYYGRNTYSEFILTDLDDLNSFKKKKKRRIKLKMVHSDSAITKTNLYLHTLTFSKY